MSSKEEWKPTLVKECSNPNIKSNRSTLDWNSKEVKEWKANAIKMQEAHVKDNSRTMWYAYLPEERDAIELRILIALYGIRMPKDKTKASPSCPLKTYNHEERLHAKKVKKAIIKQSGTPEKIYFNVIYVSHATIGEDEKLLATEEPVFIVKGSERPVDRNGRRFSDIEDYRNNNDLPAGGMILPENGSYNPNNSDDKTQLIADETPNSSGLCRVKAVTDNIAMVGGIVLSVTGLVLCAPAGVFSAAVVSAISTGSFYGGAILTAYSVISSGASIYNKVNRGDDDESIRTEIFTISTALLSLYTQRLSSIMIKGARQGQTLAQTIEGLTKIERKIFPLLNYIKVITLFSGVTGLCSAFVELWRKKERSWFDYFQFSMLLFMTSNTLAKPWTLKGLFESEQIKCLDEIKKNLTKDESKNEFDKMKDSHETSDKKAYMIRNLNQIDNKNEFFELINKTNSVVECTADGLVVNNKIDIHPKAYNAIGRDVMLIRLQQAEQYKEASFQKNMEDGFKDLIISNPEKAGEIKNQINEISKLPPNERYDAMKKVFYEFGGNEGQFDQQWSAGDKKFIQDMNKQINKTVDNMQKGITNQHQLDDFKELQKLSQKQAMGNITAEEKIKLQETLEKCAEHRKERFFQTTSDYKTMPDKTVEQWNDDLKQLDVDLSNGKITNEKYISQKQTIEESKQEAQEYLDDIKTFNNGQSERLCYRIDVEKVKFNLQQIYERTDYENIEINGKKLFQNMSIPDYDRLNRVMNDYGDNKTSLMKAATQIAQDPQFRGLVQKPSDIASITEAMIEMKKMEGIKNAPEYYQSLATGSGENYTKFKAELQSRLGAVNALPAEIQAQWPSSLSMGYHHWKHQNDFGNNPVTVEQYFNDLPNSLFDSKNATLGTFSQTGTFRQTYSQTFGTRFHVGFTTGESGRLASHFAKKDTL